ncbi:MAG: aspartyl protease family protein [Phycisphaerae bacterium]
MRNVRQHQPVTVLVHAALIFCGIAGVFVASAENVTKKIEIPFELRNGLIYIENVEVNGAGPFRFALDTGGQGMGRVDTSLVKKLSLEKTGEVRGSDGMSNTLVVMPLHEIQAIKIGDREWQNLTVASRDYQAGPRPLETDGILGIDMFKDCCLTLDYPSRKIILEPAKLDSNGAVKLSADREIPQIPILVNGHEIMADIDSGSMGGIALPKALADTLKFDGELKKIGEAITISGSFDIFAGTLQGKIEIGALQLDDPLVEVADRFQQALLGGRFLQNYVVSIDRRV